MSDTKIDYMYMVKNLSKPGSDIIRTLSNNRMHLLHMMVGIVDEHLELLEAIRNNDLVNIKEELGDLLFYTQGYAIGINVTLCLHKHKPLVVDVSPIDEVVVATKRLVIYNKDVNANALASAIRRVHEYIEDTAASYNLTMEDLMKGNMDKLLTGKNARYASGSYSDSQANDRADKG